MRKRGSSELIAEILLIIIVIMVMVIVVYFFLGYLGAKEESVKLQSELNNEKLAIDYVSFDPTNNQALSIVVAKGAGEQELVNSTTKDVSHINVTRVRVIGHINVSRNKTEIITHTNVTYITHTNFTWVNRTNVTNLQRFLLVNGSNADIVLVNDVSGSMSFHNKMPEMKNASRNFVQRVLNGTNNKVGLVAYEDNVVDAWSVPLTDNTAALLNIIDSWSPLLNTCICCGIDRGMLYLNASNRTKIMIVLSDGGANRPCPYFSPELSGNPPVAAGTRCTIAANDPCDDAINITKSGFVDRGVITYSIGFGIPLSVDEMTLRNISLVGNGTYYFSNLSGLSSVFERIQDSIIINETIIINWTERNEVNWTERNEVNWTDANYTSWNETVTTSWIEQKEETINETVEIEVYAPDASYDYLKIVFYAGGRSCSQNQNISVIPGPLETSKVDLTLDSSCGMTTDQLTKIEIYAVALTESGKEVISSVPIAVWEQESMY